jgi:hypothetical protein
LGLFLGEPNPRLYDRVVEVLRTRHYSRRTEQACIHWIRRFHSALAVSRYADRERFYAGQPKQELDGPEAQ